MSQEYTYFYGTQAEQFSFYRIPKVLFTEERFSKLTCEAKVLYGLLLDRMSLSMKNKWLDEENKVYIFFKLTEVMHYMNCSHEKAGKLLAELDDVKGIGLIERKKQGMGRPDKIYVKSFIVAKDVDEMQGIETSENQKSEAEQGRQDFRKPEVKESENSNSTVPKTGNQDICFLGANNTNKNNNEFNKSYPSINHRDTQANKNELDEDAMEAYLLLIKENIEYNTLCLSYDKESVNGIVALMLEVICSGKTSIVIGGEKRPFSIVQSRLLKLNQFHIEYVLDSMAENTTKIRNIKSYLLTALYNAPMTMPHYYQACVNHDMYSDFDKKQ